MAIETQIPVGFLPPEALAEIQALEASFKEQNQEELAKKIEDFKRRQYYYADLRVEIEDSLPFTDPDYISNIALISYVSDHRPMLGQYAASTKRKIKKMVDLNFPERIARAAKDRNYTLMSILIDERSDAFQSIFF